MATKINLNPSCLMGRALCKQWRSVPFSPFPLPEEKKKGNSKLPRLNSLPASLVLSPCPAPGVSLGREAPAVVLIGLELSGCQGESEQLRL